MQTSDLIRAIVDGDKNAFSELFAIHWDALVGYASMLTGNPALAKDIVQDVFVNLWVGRKALNASVPLRPYLLKAVHNRAVSELRKEKVQATYRSYYAGQIALEIAGYADPESNDTIRSLYSGDTLKTLEEAVALLPEKCRQIFMMRYYDKLTAKEVAQKLDISVSTVNNQVYKALLLLRPKLGVLKSIALLFTFLFFR